MLDTCSLILIINHTKCVYGLIFILIVTLNNAEDMNTD